MKFIQGESKSQSKPVPVVKKSNPIKFIPFTDDKPLTRKQDSVFLALSDGGYGRLFNIGGRKIFETITKEEYAAQ